MSWGRRGRREIPRGTGKPWSGRTPPLGRAAVPRLPPTGQPSRQSGRPDQGLLPEKQKRPLGCFQQRPHHAHGGELLLPSGHFQGKEVVVNNTMKPL